jgi:hypothetical protein
LLEAYFLIVAEDEDDTKRFGQVGDGLSDNSAAFGLFASNQRGHRSVSRLRRIEALGCLALSSPSIAGYV